MVTQIWGVVMVSQPNAMLIVEKGLPSTAPIFLEDSSLVLGNSSGADIPVMNAFVSRRHCRITYRDDNYYVSDVGSRNGTFLNGTQLSEGDEAIINSGDVLELSGQEVRFLFRAHSGGKENTTLVLPGKSDDLRVESGPREVWVKGEKILPPLSPKEFDVLALLYSKRTEVVTKDDIAFGGWPERDGDVGNHEIEQCIRRIRRRIEEHPTKPTLILTRKGVGYQLT